MPVLSDHEQKGGGREWGREWGGEVGEGSGEVRWGKGVGR